MTDQSAASHDLVFMRMALSLAKRGLGTTAPNPSVGAVVVASEPPFEILGVGWTASGGRPHAEPQALDMAQRLAGKRVRGATLYVTLEPCAHRGHTPPCAERIIAAGIGRVVCSSPDPDSRVAGRGFALLREAGIEVSENVLLDEGTIINQGHILRVTEQRPFVQLKLAVSANEKIAAGNGAPVWVTGQLARNQGHLMRARADAILVGRGTVQADNPSLTCRLPGLEPQSPIRIVLDSQLILSPKTQLFKTAKKVPLWLFCNHLEHNEHLLSDYAKLTNARAKVFKYNKAATGLIDLHSLLETLANDDNGITRLMVEGGPTVIESFLQQGLVDEFILFKSKTALEDNVISPFADNGVTETILKSGLVLDDQRDLGVDVMQTYRKRQG